MVEFNGLRKDISLKKNAEHTMQSALLKINAPLAQTQDIAMLEREKVIYFNRIFSTLPVVINLSLHPASKPLSIKLQAQHLTEINARSLLITSPCVKNCNKNVRFFPVCREGRKSFSHCKSWAKSFFCAQKSESWD